MVTFIAMEIPNTLRDNLEGRSAWKAMAKLGDAAWATLLCKELIRDSGDSSDRQGML